LPTVDVADEDSFAVVEIIVVISRILLSYLLIGPTGYKK